MIDSFPNRSPLPVSISSALFIYLTYIQNWSVRRHRCNKNGIKGWMDGNHRYIDAIDLCANIYYLGGRILIK